MSTQFSNGWAQAELGELIDKSTDKADPTEIDPVPYVGLEHIEQGTGKLSDHGQSSEVKSTKAKFSEGDLLYGKLRPYLNKVWIASFDGVCSTDILVFPPAEKVSQKYLYYRLMSSDFVQYANAKSSGVNHPRVSYKKISQFEIGLPPLPEQRRIVAKIEELFSDLEAGVADLKRAQQQLQRYRQSVLQAAVEGRLTEDWRRNNVETCHGASLLERILEERRTQWETDYRAKYEAKGKEPPSGWKSRYKEPEKPDFPDDLSLLPDEWIWTNTEHVGKVITGSTPKTSVDEYYGGEYPFYRPGDLDTGYHTRSAEKTITEAGLAEARFLKAESTLVTCIGGTIGKTGFIRKAGASNQQINALTPYKSLLPRYAYFVCVSPQFQNRIHHRSSSTTMPILNKGKFQALPFPLPPLEEQHQIVNEVERLLSVADEATQTVEREIKRAERLRQSILKQAFSGKLVGQSGSADSTEESVPVAASKEGKQIEMPL